MENGFGSRKRRDAQTLVFFTLAFGTILLLCGLAIDSGLLYLAKAKLGRAVDGAALAAVGNFNRSSVATTNRDSVATIMRNFAVANYTDLESISTSGSTIPGGIASSYTLPTGQTAYNYTYNFNDGTTDANGQYKRFVSVTLTTGSGGGITSASCNARCPVHTYFIGIAGAYFRDLKASSSAVATRNPRLIVIVLDRSASMLKNGGGAYGLPQAVTQFLDFFDTTSDYIGIVSFGSNARLEMPLTTNFIIAGTNILYDAYQIDDNEGAGVPGADPEEFATNSDYDPDYATTGIRRMKFAGQTAADDGIRLGMEQLMANAGFNDPDVIKYMVLFTDGAWNVARTLLAAPGYTNVVYYPPTTGTNFGNPNPWTNDLTQDTNLVPVPTFCPLPHVTNAMAAAPGWWADYANLVPDHTNDTWQSADGINEPLGTVSNLVGAPLYFTNNCDLGYNVTNADGTILEAYSTNIDVWIQPGAVDYVYSNTVILNTIVSNYNNPTLHTNITMYPGYSNVLVVPGYVIDGLFYDGLDLNFPDNPYNGLSTYPKYRDDNYNEPFMWPDDTSANSSADAIYNYTNSVSLERQLMFRNYPNLLTGFYIYKPDDPTGAGIEHLITDGPVPTSSGGPGAYRPLNGLGPYYPSAPFYWPFDLVGVDTWLNYCLTNATYDPDPTYQGYGRKAAYSVNMLSTNTTAVPEWAGELFYEGTGGTSDVSGTGTNSASSLMTSKAEWEVGAPQWLLNDFDASGENIMTNEPAHNTTNLSTVQVWRPLTYNGSNNAVGSLAGCYQGDPNNHTGGYVTDGNGNYYRNCMAWSGRPTHYFDFSQGKWIPIADNHTKNIQALPLGNWKAQEYAWHARTAGVTIYTVGYGYLVTTDEQALLAQIANSTNTTAGNPQYIDTNGNLQYTPGPGTSIPYNPGQPIGQQYFATNITDISNDFYQVGQAINAALTQ